MKKSKKSYVYMLRCSDKSLYTGYTTNICRREKDHNKGSASKYTRSRLPAKIVYYEIHNSKGLALSREARIKNLSKEEKEKMVQDFSKKVSRI